jgi:hypothetical protein
MSGRPHDDVLVHNFNVEAKLPRTMPSTVVFERRTGSVPRRTGGTRGGGWKGGFAPAARTR